MALASFKLETPFRRAAIGGGVLAAALLTGCATTGNPATGGPTVNVDLSLIKKYDMKPNENCFEGSGIMVLGTGGSSTKYNSDCGEKKLQQKRTEVDIAVVEQLLKRENDPISNALGMMIAREMSPENWKKLEASMGGAQNIRVTPETVVELMTAPNQTSRFVGFKLFIMSSDDVRTQVDSQLKDKGLHRGMLASIDMDQQADKANEWAKERAALPGITRTTMQCVRTRVGNQVILDCPAAKP